MRLLLLLHSFDPDFVGAHFLHFPASCCTCRSSAARSSSCCWKTRRIICSLNLACGLRLGQLDSVDREVFALSVVRDVRETPILYVCVCFARVCVCLFRLNCIKKKRIQLKYNKRIHRYSPSVPKNMAGLSLIYVAWMISLCVAVAQTGLEQGKWHLLWPC